MKAAIHALWLGEERVDAHGREASAAAQDSYDLEGEGVGHGFGRRVHDREVTRVRLRIRVPGQHLCPTQAGGLESRGQLNAALDADRKNRDALLHPLCDEPGLMGRIGTLGTIPTQLEPQLCRGLARTSMTVLEVRVVGALRHHANRYRGQLPDHP